MNPDLTLRFAYGVNILILTPVVAMLLTGPASRIFGPQTPDIPSLRLLISALWGAILICSVVGLFQPRPMMAILLLQVIYKATWIILYVVPAARGGQAVPWGPAITFIPIIIIWPLILWMAWR